MTGLGTPVHSAIFPRARAWAAIDARTFGVTPAMIETATRRRLSGDWRAACAAAAVEVQIDPTAVQRRHGADVTALLLDDLRRLAPDLLRWHFPRRRHGFGCLLDGEWVPLADYARTGAPITLVAATPPRAAAAGQRILLTVLEGSRRRGGRYDLTRHRMFWDAEATSLLAGLTADIGGGAASAGPAGSAGPAHDITALQDGGRAEEAWQAAGFTWLGEPMRRLSEFSINLPILAAQIQETHPCAEQAVIRFGGKAILLSGAGRTAEVLPLASVGDVPTIPPAAWERPVDAELLRLGLIAPHDLHPLVAAALAPGACPAPTNQGTSNLYFLAVPGFEGVRRTDDDADLAVLIRCGTQLHRVVWRDGDWKPDHDDHASREALLVRLGGATHPCSQAVQCLSTGRHILDLVESLLHHGRVGEFVQVLREHVGATVDPLAFKLSDGTDVGTVLAKYYANTVRLRATFAGAAPTPVPEQFSVRKPKPRTRRATRKGDRPARRTHR